MAPSMDRPTASSESSANRRLRVLVFGAVGTGRTQLVAELGAASPRIAALEGDLPGLDTRTADLVLLTGLDLPPSPAITPTEQARQDSALREALQAAGLGWRVVYGQGPERLGNALQAVAEVAPWAWQSTVNEAEAGRWQRLQANCEKCGDAACEHRLFTGWTAS